jgi:hypothetical protein
VTANDNDVIQLADGVFDPAKPEEYALSFEVKNPKG